MASRSLDGSRGLSSAGRDVGDRRTGGVPRGEGAVLLQHGRNLYQQGDFAAAVEAFTEALKDRDSDLLSILDSRAAAYSKLAQHDQALRDTKQMIKCGKNDERGYLRCAKTLLLNGKPDKALEVYAYGLKTLPTSHPRRHLVEQLHNKLRDKMSAKLLDPFTVLPLEVAVMILQHFNFKQIVAILRVSKRWDQFLTSMRNTWLRMDLSEARGTRGRVHWTSVRSYIRRSKGMLTHAIVKNISSQSTQRVLEFISRCPHLEHLEFWDSHDPAAFYGLIKGSKRLKTLVVSAHMPMVQERIVGFLHGIPRLERIEIHNAKPSPGTKMEWPHNLPNLKSITLGSEDVEPASFGPALFVPPLYNHRLSHAIPNLEELRLDWYGHALQRPHVNLMSKDFPRLRRLDVSGHSFSNADGYFPPDLEYLRIHACVADIDVESFPGPHLANLKTLVLSDVNWLRARNLKQLISNTDGSLRALWLDSCMWVGNELNEVIQGYFGNITELSLSRVPKVEDALVGYIVAFMPDLKVLHLSYTDISGRAIKMLADARVTGDEKRTRVDRLYVKGCEGVSSDAVAYGRARGIEVFT
ncbi:Leucine Rich Repeat domain protein [Aspergillus chevalieri]|uniref:F-box domain-containing protein n=1 Tax=Aspergillus chevalieri TaxID=182096 RepID=A0A7R7VW23_ASPCH|nr:uncharacterized protein ACHE_70686S [Aspergillus chevalieri]BCR91843.1 hypothetical protein ACHE_70686S [Aspergillus chevalieri]